MSIKIIEEELKKYNSKTKQDEKNALREISHEIALSALSRTDFFKHAAFVGGSCLRIFHGLRRFSEDLDFWTLEPSPNFLWKPYLHAIKDEFQAYGFDMHIEDREQVQGTIKRTFLKQDSIGKLLTLIYERRFHETEKLTIKLEIDIHPPYGAEIESKNIDFPFPFSVTALNKPSLFASKIAALFDKEKGRHWYDFIWYISQKWPINYLVLQNALSAEKKHLPLFNEDPQKPISFSWVRQSLIDLIQSTNKWNELRDDVRHFISLKEQEILDLWDKQFFLGHLEALGEYLQPPLLSIGNLIAEYKGARLTQKIEEALASGAAVDDNSRNGHRPLQMALKKGYKAIAKLLIEKGADLNFRDRSGLTPLQTAVNNNQFENAKILIQKGAIFNPNEPNLAFDQAKLYEFLQFEFIHK